MTELLPDPRAGGRPDVGDDGPAVLADGLVKRFGDTEALRGVSFEIPRATVLGVLGPNGAGKTTAVRILTTLLRPDAGRALIDGIDVVRQPRRARARIGLTGQYAAVDERLTGFENLLLVGRLFHMTKDAAAVRGRELLERFSLDEAADRVVKGYSGGMRRRLDIAMSLIAEPSVLFLDEPTTGLDPRSRLEMWDVIDGLVADGTTLLLTTQYLDEAERLADDIVVIDKGTVIARGTEEELKEQSGGASVQVTLVDVGALERVRGLIDGIVPAGATGSFDAEARTVTLPVVQTDHVVPTVVRALDDAGIDVLDVAVRQPTLDDVFLQLTGHAASDDDEEAEGDDAPRGGARR
ncbi:ATP-binding cassette domain-containing protein [Dermatobacter hominis]|uniref:ATP-binding cassette domain-containing protein n=1 Tax=Dermatobacter hominis TaxID=2884263 RepID=UPI001D125638|nr:ATP-binding cassette domain-containing protein [Dermatobacter hominis]UDY33884.1 ATP-binding cassette domain-containing protein [Dermatobacter hominis]